MSQWESQGSTYDDPNPVAGMASEPLVDFDAPTGADWFPEGSVMHESTSWRDIEREGSVTPGPMSVFDDYYILGAAAHTSQYTPSTPRATAGQTHSAPYAMTGMPPENALSMASTRPGEIPSREQPAIRLPSLEACPAWRAPGAPDWPEELKDRLDFVQECSVLPNALIKLGSSDRTKAEDRYRTDIKTVFQRGPAPQVVRRSVNDSGLCLQYLQPPTTRPTHPAKLEFPVSITFPDNGDRSCKFSKTNICSEDGSTLSSDVMNDLEYSTEPDKSVELKWTHTYFECLIPDERKKWRPDLSDGQQPNRERWSGTELVIRASQSYVHMLTHWNGFRQYFASDRSGRVVPHAEKFLPRLEHLGAFR